MNIEQYKASVTRDGQRVFTSAAEENCYHQGFSFGYTCTRRTRAINASKARTHPQAFFLGWQDYDDQANQY